MYYHGAEIIVSHEKNRSKELVNEARIMGKESCGHVSKRRGSVSHKLKSNTLSAPSLLTSSVTSLSASTTTSVPQSLTLRRNCTWAAPEMFIGKTRGLYDSPKLGFSRAGICSRDIRENLKPNQWTVALTQQVPTITRKQRLEKVNLRGTNLIISSSCTNQTPSLYRHSSSTVHDSQKSSFTSESPDNLSVTADESLEVVKEELTAEEIERRRIIEKCLSWLGKLPAKFSGMHILYERPPVMLD